MAIHESSPYPEPPDSYPDPSNPVALAYFMGSMLAQMRGIHKAGKDITSWMSKVDTRLEGVTELKERMGVLETKFDAHASSVETRIVAMSTRQDTLEREQARQGREQTRIKAWAAALGFVAGIAIQLLTKFWPTIANASR